MKKRPRTLPRGTSYDERAIALAKRLRIEIPPQPLTGAQWVTLWAEIGKALFPLEPPEPVTLRQLWADIGMHRAEEREPEFQWGRGRQQGSMNKQHKAYELLDPESQAQRDYRWRQRLRKSGKHLVRPDKY